MRSETEAVRALDLYGDTIRRICFIHLNNHADAEDVFQEVFLKYILYDHLFESDAHEKAWLIRVAANQCKDARKGFFRRNVYSLEDREREPSYEWDDSSREVLDAVFRLPDNYRDVIYLFYYEGYTAVEIAKMLGKRENTVYTWLTRGKKRLKEYLGGDFHE
jgi:RNA polymerase sigma-70 factor (ECF subfamily)